MNIINDETLCPVTHRPHVYTRPDTPHNCDDCGEERNEIRAALDAQEQHIKRSTSCEGVIGKAHRYRTFGVLGTDERFEACVVCGVSAEPRAATVEIVEEVD